MKTNPDFSGLFSCLCLPETPPIVLHKTCVKITERDRVFGPIVQCTRLDRKCVIGILNFFFKPYGISQKITGVCSIMPVL